MIECLYPLKVNILKEDCKISILHKIAFQKNTWDGVAKSKQMSYLSRTHSWLFAKNMLVENLSKFVGFCILCVTVLGPREKR